ncbi:hypothetical protein [Thermoleptolyngbya sp.]
MQEVNSGDSVSAAYVAWLPPRARHQFTPEQNRGYPRLKPTARYREQRSKAGQDSGQMSGFNARESAN